eukprot:TRINITY_DN9069_c0_g1_i1.p1 TRINITY_DN9069_c0_g1~~TRINITY_DN9069_c0_g1_i1.p1  ORF type:complete len:344 (+),score=97.71 TRINITY_DN9069_c0_g1_i1:132-1163(+)
MCIRDRYQRRVRGHGSSIMRCVCSTTVRTRLSRGLATGALAPVGCIGLGAMGGELAGRIVKAGHDTHVFDLSEEITRKFTDNHGGQYCGSLAELVDSRAVILTCVPKSVHVQATKKQLLEQGLLTPGTTWLDCTSGSPDDSAALSAELEALGVQFVDVAVSGGAAGAAKGILTAMVGGPKDAVERVKPIIETFASNIVHLGPAGSGHAVKAVNNTLLATNLWAVSEGIHTLVKYGVDPTEACKAISTSSGRSWVTQQRFPDHVLPGSFDYDFSLELLKKDVDTAIKLIDSQQMKSAPLMNHVAELTAQALQDAREQADHTEIFRVVDKWNNPAVDIKTKPQPK